MPAPTNDSGKGNFLLAVIAGLIAAVMGAAIWIMVADVTNTKQGIIAVFLGLMVGLAIRVAGRSTDRKFALLGALCALLGCILGDVGIAISFYAEKYNLGFIYVLQRADLHLITTLMQLFFKPLDLVFYLICIRVGYRTSLNYPRARRTTT